VQSAIGGPNDAARCIRLHAVHHVARRAHIRRCCMAADDQYDLLIAILEAIEPHLDLDHPDFLSDQELSCDFVDSDELYLELLPEATESFDEV